MTIATLLERTSRLLGSDAHSSGLLPVHWETLRFLERANRFSRTAGAVTAYLGLTKGTVSQSIKALESRGLLTKAKDAQDGRRINLLLTSAGKRLLKEDPLRITREFIAAMPAAERDGLEAGLSELLKVRLDAQQRQTFGICRHCQYFVPEHQSGSPHYCSLLKLPLCEEDSRLLCHEQVPASATRAS